MNERELTMSQFKMVPQVSGEKHPNRSQFQMVCEIEVQAVLLLEKAPQIRLSKAYANEQKHHMNGLLY
jgi:hypothetical protein